ATRGSVTAAAAAAAATTAAAAREGTGCRLVAADGARRERREQLRDLARGALGTGDERPVTGNQLLEAVLAGAACVLVDRHRRMLPRDRLRVGLHPSEGYRLHMPIHSQSRTGAVVARTLPDLTAALAGRDDVALVPTMGALHEGHRALLRAARAAAATVVMSLFVNPAQFGPGEDFARYPRDEEADLSVASAEGADVVFAPGADV